MNLKDMFSFQKKDTQTDYAVSLGFPLVYNNQKADFCDVFVYELYRKILTDCFSRSAGFPSEKESALWDSVLSTSAGKGLISLVAHAMTHRTEKLYLVLDNGFVRKASKQEEQAIDDNPGGKKGVCLCFKDFKQSTILLVLASLIESLLSNANAGLNISRSVLLKISTLRESVSLANSETAVKQAKAIEQGLKEGRGAMLDAGDSVELPTFDTDPMSAALDVIYGLISMVTGLPRAYVSGLLTAGLNASDGADELATERGLKYYFHSIFKPACEGLLGASLVFKTSNWRQFANVANLLAVLETTDLVPPEYKEKLIKELFG